MTTLPARMIEKAVAEDRMISRWETGIRKKIGLSLGCLFLGLVILLPESHDHYGAMSTLAAAGYVLYEMGRLGL